MPADHVSEQYVKQIETAAKDFLTAMKKLNGDSGLVGGEKWKAQLPKCGIAHEHFEVLKDGFEKEYKTVKAPDSKLKQLDGRVDKAEKSISIEAELLKKLLKK